MASTSRLWFCLATSSRAMMLVALIEPIPAVKNPVFGSSEVSPAQRSYGPNGDPHRRAAAQRGGDRDGRRIGEGTSSGDDPIVAGGLTGSKEAGRRDGTTGGLEDHGNRHTVAGRGGAVSGKLFLGAWCQRHTDGLQDDLRQNRLSRWCGRGRRRWRRRRRSRRRANRHRYGVGQGSSGVGCRYPVGAGGVSGDIGAAGIDESSGGSPVHSNGGDDASPLIARPR